MLHVSTRLPTRFSLNPVFRTVMLTAAAAAALTSIAARPAAAMNCQAASTRQEKAICADPAAKAADEQMAEAFAVLRSLTSGPDRDALVTDQRHWITTRNDMCGTDSRGGPLAGPSLSACLGRESNQRRLFLSGMPSEGPGLPGSIRPFFHKGKRDDRVISGLRFAAPQSDGERLFNRAVDGQLRNVNVSDGSDSDATDDFSMTLNYASPALVSADVTISYPTSAHPVDHHANINVDLAAGRMLAFENVFLREALDPLLAKCRPQLDDFIGAAAKADLGDNAMRESILKDREKLVRMSAGDIQRWSLGRRQMTLIVDDAANSRITSTCHLDTASLTPLMQPGFRLAQ
jgi:uncharacterized protein YecT (DUF1311 family)